MSKKDWVWMPHPAHLIVSYACRFHLATYLGNGYIVSTVGEWWPERSVREIHAEIHDPQWFFEHRHLKGDPFEHAYMKRFGYEEIGAGRKYETMVFTAGPETHPEAQCCPYTVTSYENLDSDGYNDAVAAREGHMALCEKWKNGEPKDEL